jgi:integrase
MTLKAAIAAHGEAADALAAGIDPAIAFKAKRGAGDVAADDTVTAYVETFRKQRFRKLAKGTQYYYGLELDLLVEAIGNRDIRRVTPRDIQKHIDDAIERGDAAQRTTWKVARAFFNWAAPRTGIESPVADIAAPSKDTERKRFLPDDEIELVWEAADDDGGAPGAMVKLLLLTGCRRDEIAYLPRAHIKADKIVFPESLTKNNEPHSVPITSMIRRVLDTLPKSGKFALTGTDDMGAIPSRGRRSRHRTLNGGRFMICGEASQRPRSARRAAASD